jgi:hypothetical protein
VVAKKEPESIDSDKFDLIKSLQEQGKDESDSFSAYSDNNSDQAEVDENVQNFINAEYKKIRSQPTIIKEVDFIVF